MTVLANGLIIAGACLLIASLVPVQRLIVKLPPGKVLRNWYILRALVCLFIVGYLVYAVINWYNSGNIMALIVPVIFFLGACFVLMVNTLSLQTALDVRRIADLEIENITDPLMGIYNRRYADRRFKEEMERALRYDLPLSVLLLDIDYFKRINDKYGHQIGDLVLESLGKLIVKSARDTDIVARYGGEEVLILATNTPSPTAVTFAERLCREVEKSVLLPPGKLTSGQAVSVTVSIGVAALDSENKNVTAFLKMADDALYQAKKLGRNRVIVSKAIKDETG